MTIQYVSGNILEANTQVLCNPVNCKGVMGAGLALQFKEAYPRMFTFYQKYCEMDLLKPGLVQVYDGFEIYPRMIFNVATKYWWKDPSEIKWIIWGAANIARLIQVRSVKSIAIPALGCGRGGLKWSRVKRILENELSLVVPTTQILLYDPEEE